MKRIQTPALSLLITLLSLAACREAPDFGDDTGSSDGGTTDGGDTGDGGTTDGGSSDGGSDGGSTGDGGTTDGGSSDGGGSDGGSDTDTVQYCFDFGLAYDAGYVGCEVSVYGWNTTTWDLTCTEMDGDGECQKWEWMGLEDHLVLEWTIVSDGTLCGTYPGDDDDTMELNGYIVCDDDWDYLVFGPDPEDAYLDPPTSDGEQTCLVQDNNGGGGEWGCDPANGDDW